MTTSPMEWLSDPKKILEGINKIHPSDKHNVV